MSSFKLFAVFVVVIVLAVVSAAAAVQPFHSAFLTKAACTLAVSVVLAAALWVSSPASSRRKAKIMVLVAITFLALSAESCGDSGSSISSSGNGCWTSLVEKNGQLVCPEKAQPIDQVIVNESIKSAQQVYDQAVDKAASAYGQAVQGSTLQQSVGALQNAGAIKTGKD